tara:strand:+ start:667 stop:1446 length:780 start_codon:yes stop_codon:yes gene_type:complete
MELQENVYQNPDITKESEFKITLDGYEGPIDLLLDLARKQKVNLSEISILKLAEQYAEFIENYKKIHLEIAADYLVMAAWLTYLKSRLLLPKEEKTDESTPEQLEEAIRYQLQRLEAMQKVSKELYSRPLIGRDTFYVNIDEGIRIKYNISYIASLFDLLKSYSNIIKKQEVISNLTINLSELQTVETSIQRIKEMFGSLKEWTNFLALIPKLSSNKIINKSYISSNFVASLELTKNDLIEIKQTETFGNIYIKNKFND